MRKKLVACFLAGLLTVSVLMQPGGKVLATENPHVSGVTVGAELGEGTGKAEAQPGTAETQSVENTAGNGKTAMEASADGDSGETDAESGDSLPEENAALPVAEGQDIESNGSPEDNTTLPVTEGQDGNIGENLSDDPVQGETPASDGGGTSGEAMELGNAVEGENSVVSEEDSANTESTISEKAENGMDSVPAGEEGGSSAEAGSLVAHAADDIVSGSYGNAEWVIDASWKLTVSGTGDYAKPAIGYGYKYSNRSPWFDYHEMIKSAVINETDINPPAELGRLADASSDKQSTRI